MIYYSQRIFIFERKSHEKILRTSEGGVLHVKRIDVDRRKPLSAPLSDLQNALRNIIFASRSARADKFLHSAARRPRLLILLAQIQHFAHS